MLIWTFSFIALAFLSAICGISGVAGAHTWATQVMVVISLVFVVFSYLIEKDAQRYAQARS